MAAMTRTSTLIVRLPPIRSNSPSCSTRSSFAWNGAGDFADLVEEQRAAVRGLETAFAGRDRAGEGALLVAEEFAFEDAFGQRRAVELDERPLRAGAGLVQKWANSSLPVPLSPRSSTVSRSARPAP